MTQTIIKTVMERLIIKADENVVSFDLNEIFNDDSNTMEELNSDDIPDSVLSEFFSNENNRVFP